MKATRPSGFAAFSVIWLGQILSTLGTRMTNFALSIWIWEATGRASDLALLTFVAFAATTVTSPLAGSLVDRMNRRFVIVLSDAGMAAATVAMLLLFLTDSMQTWHLYVINAVTGAFLAFQYPAYGSLITVMMQKAHYARANAMLSLVRSVPAIFAPALAAVLLSAISIEAVLLIDALSYVVAVGTVFMVVVPSLKPQAADADDADADGRGGKVWRDTVIGFGYIFRRPGLLGLQGILFAVGLFAAMGWILLTPMVLARTGNDEAQIGLIQSIGAIGGVAGGLLLGMVRTPANKMRWLLLAIGAFSLLGRVLLGIGGNFVIWSIAWFCAWLCIPAIDGYGQAIFQEKVDPKVQGRVFGARQVLDNFALPVALGIAGPLADNYLEPGMRPDGSLAPIFGDLVGTGPGSGMALVFVVTGLLGLLVGIAGFLARPVRDVETLIPDHDAQPEPVLADRSA